MQIVLTKYAEHNQRTEEKSFEPTLFFLKMYFFLNGHTITIIRKAYRVQLIYLRERALR